MIKAYLLTWNPARWEWPELPGLAHAVANGRPVTDRWSTGKNKSIRPGDRVFLLRQGPDRPGIIGSGMATTGVFQDVHWDDQRAAIGSRANYIQFVYDKLLDPGFDAILRRDMLKSDPDLARMQWDTRASGISIRPVVLPFLEERWRVFAHRLQD